MQEKVIKRNGQIDFLKFVFAIIIMLFHAGSNFFNNEESLLCQCGYIAVQFYFIVSGYLLAKKAYNSKSQDWVVETTGMIKNKILHLFPFILLATLSSIVFYNINNFSFNLLSQALTFSVPEMLGLQMYGYSGFWATGVSWYLSALFFISMLLYPILLKNRKAFSMYFAPISVLFAYGFINVTAGSLTSPDHWYGIVYRGMIIGYAAMALGCIAFEISLYINNRNFDSFMSKASLFIIEWLGFIVTFVYTIKHHADSVDFFIPLVLLFSVAITFSNKSLLNKFFSNKVCYFLGEFSLSIYLNHYYVEANITRLFPQMSRNYLLLISILMILILSLFNHFVGKWLSKHIKSVGCIVAICLLITSLGMLIMLIS